MNLSKNDISTLVFQFSEFLENQIRIDNATPSVIDFNPAGNSTSATQQLENCIPALNTCQLDTSGGDDNMASKHRLRAVIGHDADGSDIITQINAPSELALADKVVTTYINTGRIADFFPLISAKYSMTFGASETPAPGSKHNMREYTQHWRETYKQGGAKGTQMFRDAKQNVILAYFGEMNIEDISAETVQGFINQRAKSGYKLKTVKADIAYLREILNSAVRDGLIRSNPAKDDRITNPAEDGEGTKALTPDQYKDIRRAITSLEDQTERVTLALFAHTSFRREEVLALRWRHIDFAANVIRVREALTFVKGRADHKGTKTKESARDFPLSAELKSILLAAKGEDDHYVVSVDSKGSAITSARFRALWNRIGQHVNLYGATPINFRTSFVTNGIASNVDPRTMAKLCGHSNTDTTMKVYAKVVDRNLPAAIDAMTAYLT